MGNSAPADTTSPTWITPGAAAAMLGCTARHIAALVDSGELDGYRPEGQNTHRRVSLASVRARLGGSRAGSSGRGDDVA